MAQRASPGHQDVLAVTAVEEKADPPLDDHDVEAWVDYSKAKNDSARRESFGGQERKPGEVNGDREDLNGINPNARKRSRCYLRKSDYQLLPKRRQRDRQRTGAVPYPFPNRALVPRK